MTRRLARLADIAYRRRGRVVLAWIVATVVIIGLGSSLAGEYNADYNTPGSESKAASEFTKREFSGYSGQEIYVVWKDPQGSTSPATKRQMNAFFKPGRKGQPRRAPGRDPRLRRRHDRDHDAAAQRARLGGQEGAGRRADRRRRRQRRRRPEDRARRRTDLHRAGTDQPRGSRLPRRGDRAADRLRLAGRGRPAAADRPGRAGDLLRRPDRAAGQRDRRPQLDHRGLGPDRHRRRHRLLAARPDPLPGGDARRQGPPRRRRRGGLHGRPQRADRRQHRGHRGARALPHRPPLHVRGGDLGLARGAGRDAGLDHAAAGAALLPRARRSTACASPSSAADWRRKGPATPPPPAGATPCSGGPGPRRSSPPRSCSPSPRRRWACASAFPTPATTNPAR